MIREEVCAGVAWLDAELAAPYPGASVVAEIANRIVSAVPAGWFSNDDDYVDSFYTLEKGQAYTNRVGAAGNAKISLVPSTLPGN